MKRVILSFTTIYLCLLFFSNCLARSSANETRSSRTQQSYRALKFSVVGLKRTNEHNAERAAPGHELVLVSTIIDRSDFKEDFRGNECRLDRAKLYDAKDKVYNSSESRRIVTVRLRDEYGRVYGDAKINYDWTFEVPTGKRLKTFKFNFADERIITGGANPDENVTSLSFDLTELEGANTAPPKVMQTDGTIPFTDEVKPPLPAGLRFEIQYRPEYLEGGIQVGYSFQIRLTGETAALNRIRSVDYHLPAGTDLRGLAAETRNMVEGFLSNSESTEIVAVIRWKSGASSTHSILLRPRP